MTTEYKSTKPKNFIFVLMPFDPSFNDIYKFGIKGAADDVGAYAERVDEQIFNEGILDHIFKEIHKADVIVADMTNRNPNVFYEVGYAHALGKIVILLTHNADDIPFDLKQRQHIIYGGSIDTLRVQLRTKLQWAISVTRKGEAEQDFRVDQHLRVVLSNCSLIPSPIGITGPSVERVYSLFTEYFELKLELNNNFTSFPLKSQVSPPILSSYLFFSPDSTVFPYGIKTNSNVVTAIDYDEASVEDSPDGLTKRICIGSLPSLSYRASQIVRLIFKSTETSIPGFESYFPMRLRLVLPNQQFDYPFLLHYGYAGRRA